MSPRSSPAFAIGATLSGRSPRPSSSAGSQTASHAGPETPRASDNLLLRGAERQARPAAVGVGHRALEQAAGSGPDLGRLQSEPPPQRLDELQQKLVERERAAQPRPERAQHVRSAPPLDGQERGGEPLEPAARRLVEQRRNGGGAHRDGEHGAFAAVGKRPRASSTRS